MNIPKAKKLEQLERFLDALDLKESNKALARTYLIEGDDNLLAQAQPQDLQNIVQNLCPGYTDYLHAAQQEAGEDLARCIKLFWAIGKSTASYLLNLNSFTRFDAIRPVCVDLLGKPATVAMTAEILAWNSASGTSRDMWLYSLAQTEPDVLEAAQALGGTQWDNMKVLLAGILLSAQPTPPCPAERNALVARQAELIAHNNVDSLDGSTPGLTDADRQALTAWLERGDPAVPLPDLSVAVADGSDPRALLDKTSQPLSDYLTGLLGRASFLGQRQDPRLRCAVIMYMALNPIPLTTCFIQSIPGPYLLDQLEVLLEDLPGGEVTLLLCLGSTGVSRTDQDLVQPLIRRCAGGLRQALDLANVVEASRLISLIPDDTCPLDMREFIASMLAKPLQSGQRELLSFLLEEGGDLQDAAARLAPVSHHFLFYARPNLEGWLQHNGLDDFFCRCLVVLGLVYQGLDLAELLWKIPDMREPAQALLDRKLPVAQLLAIFGAAYDSILHEQGRAKIRDAVRKVLARPEYGPELCAAVGQSGLSGRSMALTVLDDLSALPGTAGAEAKAAVLARAGDTSKQIRKQLVDILSAHPDWAPDIALLLQSKKSTVRLVAVQAAGRIGQPLRPALQAALATEKIAKVADAISAVLAQPNLPPATAGDGPDPEQLALDALKGGKRRRFQWLLEPPLPAVRKTDGTPAGEDRRDALLAVFCGMNTIGRSTTAAALARDLDPDDLAALAVEVYERWLAAGAPSKAKWVLAFAVVLGGPAMTPRLQQAILDWSRHARGALACDAVTALALSQAPDALPAVDTIARKCKARQVRTAAAAALEKAARELGLTAEELGDRLVPNLGFAGDGTRIFDYGPRQFTVRLTADLELSITNDRGDPVKRLPAPGKADDPDKAAAACAAYKGLKKQIRTTVADQKTRLESALIAMRCWDAPAWQALFVRNPLMRQFAIRLIWGVYRQERLTATFRYMEDGSFNTVDEEEYTLPDDARIALVHPIELDEETRGAWIQQLEDYEITPSIPQLERPVFRLQPGREKDLRLEDFGGRKLNGLTLTGKLLALGWCRGSVRDGGSYYTFYREDPLAGIGVVLNFSGCFIGVLSKTVTVYDAVFYKAGAVQHGSDCDDTPPEADILPLGRVPARYYSEILGQLTRATASSTETDPEWKTALR